MHYQKMKYKYGHDNKKCEKCKIKYKDCECHLEYTNANDNLVVFRCICYKRDY